MTCLMLTDTRKMEDFDLSCLPTDFENNSKPSPVIEALYKRREEAEQRAIETLHKSKEEICRKYEELFTRHSEALKSNLDRIRGLVKNQLFMCKVAVNKDNANFLDKNHFKGIYKRIHEYKKEQSTIIGSFYDSLIRMEREKSKEFTKVLKVTYEDVKRISHRLPHECDKFIEMELENVNQSLLCNHRNYIEVRTQIEAEVLNYTKNAIQDLQYVKEYWLKYIRIQADKELWELRNSYTPVFTNTLKNFSSATEQLVGRLSKSASVVKYNEEHPEEWLEKIRKTVALLDQKAQKLMLGYKQVTVIIYNKFFEELKVIEETLKDMPTIEQISDNQAEMYTPDLNQILGMYNAELQTIQEMWNELIEKITATVNNTQAFLVAATTLWEKYFRRTENLQIIILKDMENLVKLNNNLYEPYESKLNILIDTLRQEVTKDRVKKCLEDIKKQMKLVEEQLLIHYQNELALLKKYKNHVELNVDVLLVEIKRFLELYPPDKEIDPKIQRQRGSRTMLLPDPTEGLIPNQMLYCKYQIGAISNWQFGVWESIKNYVDVARTQIMADADNWIEKQIVRLNRRKDIRISYHRAKLRKIEAYIYEERLEELCVRETRLSEHKAAVERRLPLLKEKLYLCKDIYETLLETFKKEALTIESRCLNSKNYSEVASLKPILKAKCAKSIENVDAAAEQYLQECDLFCDEVKASHVLLLRSVKLFSEGGSFSGNEIKGLTKELEKVEAQLVKVVAGIKESCEECQGTFKEEINQRSQDLLSLISLVQEEHAFVENVQKRRKELSSALFKEACLHQSKFRSIVGEFANSKEEVLRNCGVYNYFPEFSMQVKHMIGQLKDMVNFFDEAVPVRFYSDKSQSEIPASTQTSRISSASSATGKKQQASDSQKIEEVTKLLFNFPVHSESNTYFVTLNRIILKSWNDIIDYSKQFYKTHHGSFYLDQDKLPQTHIKLVSHLYKVYFQIQNQCETKTMQDTKEFLCFAEEYLEFLNDYIDSYMDEFSRKMLKSFEQFYENEIRQILWQSKANIIKQYENLQKKLKPLYGHPKNKKILEKLQIESEIIYSEAKELFENIKNPHLENLQNKFGDAVDQCFALNEQIPEMAQIVDELRSTLDNLNLRLNEKVNLLRMIVDYPSGSEAKQTLINHCKSFLSFYDSKTMNPYTDMSSGSMLYKCKEPTVPLSPPFEPDSMSSSKQSIESNTAFSHATVHTVTTFELEADPFLVDLKQNYAKYTKEVESQDLKICLDTLRAEWWFAVKTVMDLYTVKYNQLK